MQSKKNEQLGQPFGTACGRLRIMVMFDLVAKAKLNQCFRCGKQIEHYGEFSIDHKVDWLDNDPALFWDLTNIAFSHRQCNRPRIEKIRINSEPGQSYCGRCKRHLRIARFSKHARKWNGLREWCRECVAAYDKQRMV